MSSPNHGEDEVFEVVDDSMDNVQRTSNQVEYRSRYSSIPCSTNNTRGRAMSRFRKSLRRNTDGRSTNSGVNRSQSNNRNTRGERGDPSYFRNDRWRNEEKRCMMIPSWYCAICCRVLYEYEVYLMKFEVERELDMFMLSENLIWPILSYRDPGGERYLLKRKKGKIVVCPSHKGHGRTIVSNFKEYIKFVNTKWSYPGDIPEELSSLDIRFEEFLSPIRLLIASEWIRANNPLFFGQNPSLSVYADGLIPEIISTQNQSYINEDEIDGEDDRSTFFQGEIMMPVNESGPQTADEKNAFENLIFGVDDRMAVVNQGRSNLEINNYSNSKHNEVDYDSDDDSHCESQSDSDSETDEVERDESEGISAYSRTTLKAYARFRLLSVDRRFGTSLKYIFMLFDWAQKQSVFGYHNRRVPLKMNGRNTTAADVRERSTLHSGYRHNESSTVSIHAGVRTGPKYKQKLYCKISALFDAFGDPQLFGTFTCNDREPGQFEVAEYFHGEGAPTHKDPVLFLNHWKQMWQRFFRFVRKDWARMHTGGDLVAWCWVLEMELMV
ncbi:hypothetical protein FBU30_000708 [Linnemannia zychae]|nr:hypothetical protein FBU30_000708 [Linnemannia zychae]